MKIETRKIRAASKFMAKNDAREYLCGIRINNKFIEATNGHIAVRMDSGIKTNKDIIVKLIGRIPAKSIDTELVFKNGKNTAYHYDGFKNLVGVQLFDVIDGKFPDLEKVIPSILKKTEFPNINAIYLKVIHDAFAGNRDDFFGAKAVGYEINKVAIFKLGEIKNTLFGNPLIIIMPMREELEK